VAVVPCCIMLSTDCLINNTASSESRLGLVDFEFSIPPERTSDDRLDADGESPPYSGTCWSISRDTITPEDPTSYTDIKATGERRYLHLFDRNHDGWQWVNAYLFIASYTDQRDIEFRIHPDIGETNGLKHSKWLAEMFGRIFLPFRECVHMFDILPGDHGAGAGGMNGMVMFHLDYALRYKGGSLEEVAMHEAAHACLDNHMSTPEWKDAMKKDGRFISTYARDYPNREDVSESSTSWFAVRKRKNRQPDDLVKTTEATIPNRLDYFDKHIGGEGYGLIKSGVECNSRDRYLGKFDFLDECANACRNKKRCRFFIYGTSNKKGWCYWEKTSDKSCSEGWENDNYDFYSLGKDVLRNTGTACWNECGKQQGPCSFCGTGSCCRKGWHDTSNGCDGSSGIDGRGHVCVET